MSNIYPANVSYVRRIGSLRVTEGEVERDGEGVKCQIGGGDVVSSGLNSMPLIQEEA